MVLSFRYFSRTKGVKYGHQCTARGHRPSWPRSWSKLMDVVLWLQHPPLFTRGGECWTLGIWELAKSAASSNMVIAPTLISGRST